jgi:UDP:flavonoid glycosyltransferase YjiC (YdhE family)
VNILLCPLSDGGYLYPAGRELQRRGNSVGVLGRSAAASVVAQAGLPFAAAEGYGGRGGFSVARWGHAGLAQFRATLRAASQAQADVLVTSVLSLGALLAAEVLDVPVVVLGLSVHLWRYRTGGDAEPQPPREQRTRETLRLYRALREETGLAARSDAWPESPLYGAALLLRGDPVLEFPGAVLPRGVQHVGPLAWEPVADRAELDTVQTQLDRVGKPIVYVHLGRFFGGPASGRS